MTQKQAHTVFLVFDFIFIFFIWLGFDEFKNVLAQIANNSDTIRFSNRSGFFTICAGMPLIHGIMLADHLIPSLQKKYPHIANIGLVSVVVSLIFASFIASSWLKSNVENAGYVYCWKANSRGLIARTLTYTKDMKICEKLTEN